MWIAWDLHFLYNRAFEKVQFAQVRQLDFRPVSGSINIVKVIKLDPATLQDGIVNFLSADNCGKSRFRQGASIQNMADI